MKQLVLLMLPHKLQELDTKVLEAAMSLLTKVEPHVEEHWSPKQSLIQHELDRVTKAQGPRNNQQQEEVKQAAKVEVDFTSPYELGQGLSKREGKAVFKIFFDKTKQESGKSINVRALQINQRDQVNSINSAQPKT